MTIWLLFKTLISRKKMLYRARNNFTIDRSMEVQLRKLWQTDRPTNRPPNRQIGPHWGSFTSNDLATFCDIISSVSFPLNHSFQNRAKNLNTIISRNHCAVKRREEIYNRTHKQQKKIASEAIFVCLFIHVRPYIIIQLGEQKYVCVDVNHVTDGPLKGQFSKIFDFLFSTDIL